FNSAGANVIAAVLVVGCLLLLMADLRLRSRRRLSRVGSGARRYATPVRLGRLAIPVLGFLTAVAAASLGVPLYGLAHWMWVGSSTAFPVGEIAAAAGTTVALGLAAAGICVALAVPVAWL